MNKIKLTKEEEQKIIELYKNYIPISKIIDIIGVNKQIIYRVLKDNCIELHGEKRVLDTKQRQEVVNQYLDNKTLEEIAKSFNVNRWTIKNILKENGIVLRKRGDKIRKYSVNENFFDEINTPEKAYIIGLLWSDGCNKTDRGCISLKLQDTDKHILEDIKKVMDSNHPLYFIKRQKESHHNMYSLEISSRKLSNKLEELGMVGNKSLIVTFPDWINEKLYPAFLLGLVDGDGSISKSNYNVSIVGTKYLLGKIKNILDSKGINSHIYNYNKNNITEMLVISKKNDALKFLNWIYNSGSTLFLNRKYNTYVEKYLNINNSLIA